MSADVCCQCVARGIPWQSTARQLSAQQIAPADASMPIESLELDLQSTPVLGSSFQAHGSAIPGHPGPSRAIRLLLWCSFMLKTGKNLKNLVTWEVEEMWTLDNLEMILVGLNCLKFFLKSN